MRNRISVLAALILVAYGMFGADLAQATSYKTPGIRGTSHDFARRFGCYDGTANAPYAGRYGTGCTAWGTKGADEICIFCHAPHNAVGAGQAGAPLWNRSYAGTGYTMYANPEGTMKATPGTEPLGVSKLCLSCHDGTTALDNFGSVTTGTHFTGSRGTLGKDLSNDHPISFVYQGDDSMGGIWSQSTASGIGDIPTGVTTGSGTVISDGGSTNSIEVDMLKNGRVECTSCHEPHGRYGWDKLLIKNNTGSRLCLTCHNK